MDRRPLEAEAKSLIDEGLCRGIQLAMCKASSCQELAIGNDGLGHEIDVDTLFAVYCAAKPILAMCVAELCATGAIESLDARLGDVCPELDVADVTLRSLLDHSSGVHSADGDHIKLFSSKGKLRAALVARPLPEWDPCSQAGYSEFIAWQLLALAIEHVTGAPWPDVVNYLVVEKLDLASHVHVVLRADAHAARIGVNLDLRSRPRPLLSEMSPSFRSPNPAYGCFATSTGLACLLHTLSCDPSSPGAPLLEQPARGRRWDEVMQTTGDALPGLMLHLPDYGVTEVSSNTYGHTGLMGLTTVLHDPDEQTTACITFVGLIDGPTSINERRPRILRHLLPPANSNGPRGDYR